MAHRYVDESCVVYNVKFSFHKKGGFYIIFMDILGLLGLISCLDFFKHPVLHLKRQVRVVPQEGNEVTVTLWTY